MRLRKGRSSPKENPATGEYEERGPGSHAPSGNTGQGVRPSGELKGYARRRRETDKPAAALRGEGRGLKGPGVTRMRPEAGRSSPG